MRKKLNWWETELGFSDNSRLNNWIFAISQNFEIYDQNVKKEIKSSETKSQSFEIRIHNFEIQS